MTRFELPDNSYLEDQPALRGLDESGVLINVFRAILRSPKIVAPIIELGAAQFADGSLSAVDRELAILAAGACVDAPYEAAQHEPLSREVGVTDEQREAVAAHRWSDTTFSPSQQTMLEFVARVSAHPTVPDNQYAAMRQHYTEQQLVELVVLVGYYFMIGRVTTVFEIPIDVPDDTRLLDSSTGQATTP